MLEARSDIIDVFRGPEHSDDSSVVPTRVTTLEEVEVDGGVYSARRLTADNPDVTESDISLLKSLP